MENISFDQAAGLTSHDMLWRVHMRDGSVVWEQPGVSSDHFDSEDVSGVSYVPVRSGLPTIDCPVDLARGERFVRYWTTIWKPDGRGSMLLYVLGVENAGKHALLCFYPRWCKISFAATRPFNPSWTPNPTALLPEGHVLVGGPGTPLFGWRHDGFGGVVEIVSGDAMVFRGLY